MMNKNLLEKCKKIKLVISDVDGVLTDGGMYYSEKGEELKKFNTKDGMAVELLQKNEIPVILMTKEKSKIVLQRAKKIQIKKSYIGITNKEEKLVEICKKFKVGLKNIAYIGDDINDLEIMKKVGFSASPNMEVLSMAGCLATINEMQDKKTIEYCWEVGKKLFDGWNKIISQHNFNANMVGYPIRMNPKFFDSSMNESLPLKSLIFQEMVKKGFFISPLNAIYLSYSHSLEDIELTLSTFDVVLTELSKKIKNENYLELLEGNLPKTIWTMSIPSTKKTI